MGNHLTDLIKITLLSCSTFVRPVLEKRKHTKNYTRSRSRLKIQSNRSREWGGGAERRHPPPNSFLLPSAYPLFFLVSHSTKVLGFLMSHWRIHETVLQSTKNKIHVLLYVRPPLTHLVWSSVFARSYNKLLYKYQVCLIKAVFRKLLHQIISVYQVIKHIYWRGFMLWRKTKYTLCNANVNFAIEWNGTLYLDTIIILFNLVHFYNPTLLPKIFLVRIGELLKANINCLFLFS